MQPPYRHIPDIEIGTRRFTQPQRPLDIDADAAWQRFQEIEKRWVGISDQFRLVSEERQQAYRDYEQAKQKVVDLPRPATRLTPQ